MAGPKATKGATAAPDVTRLVALVKAGAHADAEVLFDRRFKAGDRTPAVLALGLRIKSALKRPRDLIVLGGLLARVPGALEPRLQVEVAQAHLSEGDAAAAATQMTALTAAVPQLASAWLVLGHAQRALKAGQPALQAFKRAAELDPTLIDAVLHLGITLRELGRADLAIDVFKTLLRREPSHLQARGQLIQALETTGRKAEAITELDLLIKIHTEPSAEMLFRAARLRHETNDVEGAIPFYRRALERDPNHLGALNNLGVALAKGGREDEAAARDTRGNRRHDPAEEMNRLDEAILVYRKAVEIDPTYAAAWSNLGNAYSTLGDYENCVAAYQRALDLTPDQPDAYSSLGSTLQWGGEFDRADTLFRQALAIRRNFPIGEFNLATLCLLRGDWAEGWEHYESRFRWHPDKYERADLKRWDGDPADPGLLVVANEQGLGDSLQFIRFWPLLAAQGYDVVIQMEPKLVALMRDAYPDVPMVTIGDRIPVGARYWFPLMSIPRMLGTRVETIPASVPYLKARPALVEAWSQRLGTHGFKIAFAWQGNPKRRIDLGRSFTLEELAPLAAIPGVRLIAIQKGVGLGQLAQCSFRDRIEMPGDDFDSGPDAFLDTAAVMQMADLVITPDTSIVHLAGALGRPTMVGIKKVPDWRWLLDREDTPFYPTVKLYRQAERGVWADVITRMAADVAARVAASAS